MERKINKYETEGGRRKRWKRRRWEEWAEFFVVKRNYCIQLKRQKNT